MWLRQQWSHDNMFPAWLKLHILRCRKHLKMYRLTCKMASNEISLALNIITLNKLILFTSDTLNAQDVFGSFCMVFKCKTSVSEYFCRRQLSPRIIPTLCWHAVFILWFVSWMGAWDLEQSEGTRQSSGPAGPEFATFPPESAPSAQSLPTVYCLMTHS